MLPWSWSDLFALAVVAAAGVYALFLAAMIVVLGLLRLLVLVLRRS
jgi:hypothetical protein